MPTVKMEAHLALLFEFFLFVVSTGVLFSKTFRANYVAIGCAAILAIASSYLTIEELSKRAAFTEKSVRKVELRTGGRLFSASDLAGLAGQAGAHVCEAGCYLARYTLLRLPLRDIEGNRRVFLVTDIKSPACEGSGGCTTGVIVWDDDKMYLIDEGYGIGDRQALLIARDALTGNVR